MIIAFSIYYGFRNAIEEKIMTHAAHLQLERFSITNSREEMPVSVKDLHIYQDADTIVGIKQIQRYAHKWGLLKTDSEVSGVLIKGIGAEYDTLRLHNALVAGRLPNIYEEKVGREVLISQRMARKMQLKVNDKIILYFIQEPPRARRLTISGIYNTGLEEFDDLLAIADIRTIQQINNWEDDMVGGLEIFVDDFEYLDEYASMLRDEVDLNLLMGKITYNYAHFFNWFEMMRQNVFVLIIIILFVVIFNIASILLILIMERVRLIGSLKAMGAKNWQIQKVFIFNGMRMTLKGLFWGNIVGILFCILQTHFELVPLDPETYYIDHVPVIMKWSTIFWLNALLFGCISASLLIPTAIVGGIKPIKSIKFS
ncbi:ABC transporter permease [Algivirga pacifica]|uniref:ABC transporter permease n=1 Tax=Algivirga pacifica TaxID=1162670 RepID=A0ABP9D5S4_9BACT